jgi:hypothetical protein
MYAIRELSPKHTTIKDEGFDFLSLCGAFAPGCTGTCTLLRKSATLLRKSARFQH